MSGTPYQHHVGDYDAKMFHDDGGVHYFGEGVSVGVAGHFIEILFAQLLSNLHQKSAGVLGNKRRSDDEHGPQNKAIHIYDIRERDDAGS